MKKLSIEEKAKRYDGVVNKLRGFISQGVDPLITRSDVQNFFPELQESDDERIRKELVDFLKETIEYGGISPDIWNMNNAKKWIAWIEKQGEQKSSSWSEDDEEICHAIENCVCECVHSIGTVRKVRCCNWLKDIKYKNGWKPSDDQMYSLKNALNVVIGERSEYHLTIQELRSLYDDLKKLKED